MRALGLALAALALSSCDLLQPNRAPTATFRVIPGDGYAPLEVSFDASRSADPDGDALSYTWTFGDGATGSGERTTHTFEHPATYDVVLRITDPEGLEDATMATVDVYDVPDGHVVLQFEWEWAAERQRVDAAVSWNLYLAYRGRLRTPLVDNYDYGAFVEDPLDDPTLDDLADALRRRAGGDGVAYAAYVLSFVQAAIDYALDPPGVEWPLYPIETLIDREGDCEDTAILYVSLLKARGIGCRLAFVDTDDDGSPDHVLALVEVPSSFAPAGGKVFVLDGTRYAVAETASGPIDLGADPWGLGAEDLIEFWSF